MKKLLIISIRYQVFVFAMTLLNCSGVNKEHGNRPNIVIILTDDLGYGDISAFGQKDYKTPNIDRIGEEGVTSTSFYVPTPYCAPSRATLLTGRFPLRHNLIKNPTPDAHVLVDTIGLNPNEITLAEIFKKVDYKTKAIGKWHLGHKSKFFPIEQGFDEYYGILYSNDMRPVQIIQDRDTIQYPVDQRYLTKDYTDKAIEFIKRQQDKPFLLYLSHAMPHKPLAASEGFYSPETPNDLYADVIKELDWSVGEIIQELKDLEILENTIVIFMSDNGPWYGGSAGGLKGMKATTWEGGIRVPFMIRYPKVLPQAININMPLWSPDILPTLCSLSDVEAPEGIILDGQDITTHLQGKETCHKPVFSMHNSTIMSIRKGNYKLFFNKPPGVTRTNYDNWRDPRAPDGTTILAQKEQPTPAEYPGIVPSIPINDMQLFNLSEDPTESNDIATSHPKVVKDLIKEYHKFYNNIN